MNKTESIARKILGWKLNRWDRWYDYEQGMFIYDSDFQPEKNLVHALMIVDKLEDMGFRFIHKGETEVGFNHITGTGETRSEAITNAAFSIIEHSTLDDNRQWHQV